MFRKLLLLFTVSLICILPAAQASADTGLFGAGVRFSWNNYSKPVLVHGSPYSDTTPILDTGTTFGGPTFGGELQVRPITRLSIGLSLDMGMTKHSVFPNTSTGLDLKSEASIFKFGFLIGVKFYVIEPEVKKAALYLHLAGGKYFANAKNDLVNNPEYSNALATELDAATQVAGDLNAPVVIQLAVGAEFYAAEAFSIGADILGFKMGFAKSKVGIVTNPDDGLPLQTVWSGDHKLFTMSIYSALTLNFGFGSRKGGKKSASSEQDAWGGAGSSSGSASSGAGASAAGNDGWGNAGSGETAPANDGWGSQPADQGTAPANEGWEAQPAADQGAGGEEGGWAAQPEPESSGGGGGGRAKAKSKSKSSSPSTPPPPPPGY